MSKPLESNYFIPHEAMLDGAQASINNGLRLRFDAEVLFQSGKYVSAYTLAIFSSEEFGKSVFLSKNHYEGKGVTRQEYKDVFTKHPAKISYFLEQTAEMLREEDRPETVEWFRKMGTQEHFRKIRSLYVDWASGKWSLPDALNEDDMRAQAIEAKRMASIYSKFAEEALKGNSPWVKRSQKLNIKSSEP